MSHEKIHAKITEILKDSIEFIQNQDLAQEEVMEFWIELLQISQDQISMIKESVLSLES